MPLLPCYLHDRKLQQNNIYNLIFYFATIIAVWFVTISRFINRYLRWDFAFSQLPTFILFIIVALIIRQFIIKKLLCDNNFFSPQLSCLISLTHEFKIMFIFSQSHCNSFKIKLAIFFVFGCCLTSYPTKFFFVTRSYFLPLGRYSVTLLIKTKLLTTITTYMLIT